MARGRSAPPKYPRNNKKLRALSLDQMPIPKVKSPPRAGSVRLQCPIGHQFSPPWATSLDFEYAPIQSADGAEWTVSEIDVPCEVCGLKTAMSFPRSEKQSGNILLYGDESYFWNLARSHISYFYCFFGANNEGKARLVPIIRDVKTAIRPSDDPDTWPLHAAEMRSSRWREKHNVRLTTYDIDSKLKLIASSIEKSQGDLFPFVTIAPSTKRIAGKNIKENQQIIREKILIYAILAATDVLTEQGFSPSFRLEQIDLSSEDDYMDFLTERIGRGLHRSLAFHYASRGKLIGLPTQVDKMASFEIECADLIAYWTQRHFARKALGKECEIPLESFGSMMWGAFVDQRFGVFPGVGFPWDTFYPSWVPTPGIQP